MLTINRNVYDLVLIFRDTSVHCSAQGEEILGDTDIKTTMRYAHLERKDATSEARDIINRLNKEREKPVLSVIK